MTNTRPIHAYVAGLAVITLTAAAWDRDPILSRVGRRKHHDVVGDGWALSAPDGTKSVSAGRAGDGT